MRIIRNIEQARRRARKSWGPAADAWICGGTRFVSHDKLAGNPAPAAGWNHFDGQGDTWDAAFIDAAFNSKLKATEAEPAATIKEYFPHDICPGCGKPSVPLEGVPDQSGRGCGQCGREWFEDMSRPAQTA